MKWGEVTLPSRLIRKHPDGRLLMEISFGGGGIKTRKYMNPEDVTFNG